MTLDAFSLLHPAGPGVERSAHRAEPGDDLVLVDGCFLQHPEFHGAWDLVVFLRDGPPRPAGPFEDPDQTPAAARYSIDGAFAAGLLPHLPDPGLGLAELARVVRPGGRLVLFHPSGRAALVARHGRLLRGDDLAPDPLRRLLQRTGWWLARYDDGPDRFVAVAERVSP